MITVCLTQQGRCHLKKVLWRVLGGEHSCARPTKAKRSTWKAFVNLGDPVRAPAVTVYARTTTSNLGQRRLAARIEDSYHFL